jgi:hypothetical protein
MIFLKDNKKKTVQKKNTQNSLLKIAMSFWVWPEKGLSELSSSEETRILTKKLPSKKYFRIKSTKIVNILFFKCSTTPTFFI